MKKLLLIALTFTTSLGFAQNSNGVVGPNIANALAEDGVPSGEVQKGVFSGQFRDVSGVAIGSAGNLFTVLSSEANCLAYNESTNSVAFIHRNDPAVNGGTVDNFRYDVSTDGGNTFTIDYGLVNPGAPDSINGRFPNALIYNQNGSTNPDSTFMVYLGSWHNDSSWQGVITGVANLSGQSASFTDNVTHVMGGKTGIFNGLCQGEEGVFWAVAQHENVGFSSTVRPVNGLNVAKGVWNNTTNDVDWTFDSITVAFDNAFDGSSRITSENIAFDPTGQYGWIAFLGDVIPVTDSVYNPVFFNTIDSGKTWNGPLVANLKNMPNVASMFATSGVQPTTGFEADLVVDKNGEPHLGVVLGGAGAGQPYTIASGANLGFFDITFDFDSLKFFANYVDTVQAFRGEDLIGASDQDNRPLASRSKDGSYVFFTWIDSDPLNGGGTNTAPNLHATALDVDNKTWCPTVIVTEGDGDYDQNVLFPTNSPVAKDLTVGYNIPMTFTQPTNTENDPVNFYYIKDINFTTPEAKIGIAGSNMIKSFTDESLNFPASWTWDFGDASPVSNLQDPTHSYATKGDYTVTLIVENCWGSDTTTRVVSAYPVGLEDVVDASSAKLFPNPTKGTVHVEMDSPVGDYSIEVYNISGALISSQNFYGSQANLDLSKLANGTYILKFVGEKVTGTQRVIKQ